ncbi:MAG: hypothetical protein E7658_09310 [Ruminococcaceae bacterium]|nr:hypothetical protein [Oscillospiraceae bacterium]
MFDLSMFDLVEFLYYLIPAAALLFFGICLILYISARRKNKRVPGTFTEGQMRVRLICLIVSAIIAGLMLAIVLAFMALLFLAVAFM